MRSRVGLGLVIGEGNRFGGKMGDCASSIWMACTPVSGLP
jgi:hypothetical protein